jgi:acyl-CoA hydrolase/GNAT superfamily N-acetyltransferase
MKSKTTTSAEAIHAIEPGRRIFVASGAAEPETLVDALVTHGQHLADNEVVHLLTLGKAPYVAPEMEGRFRHRAFFIGPNVRQAVQEGRADFVPIFLSEIPLLLRSGKLPIDVALLQVSPPDRHGYVSLGVSVDIVRAAADTARMIIAEINPRMPRTRGDTALHVSRIDYLIPVDRPLLERPHEELDDVDRAIGRHVASLVPDGATLQLGIGKIPDAVLASLSGHQDLGVHTEMMSDGAMDLAERGVITGRRKTFLPGKIVTSFIMGTRRLYEWVDDHPAIELRPSELTNDPAVIARNERMVSINSALAVDLTGQVAADSVGGRFLSGIGGQVDFVRGAAKSKDGRSMIALPSTAKNGTISRLVPALEEGAGVVTTRGDVHYVVTEHGVADLWGKSVRERALSLIEIAHPDFRGDLLSAAKRRRFVFVDQVPPAKLLPIEERRHTLEDRAAILTRAARPSDEPAVQDLFYRLGEESARQRFFSTKRVHPHFEVQRSVAADGITSLALVAMSADDQLLSLGRLDRVPGMNAAELSLVVREEHHGRGIGTRVFARLLEEARARGIADIEMHVLFGNRGMLALAERSGYPVDGLLEDGVHHLVLHLSTGATATSPVAPCAARDSTA